MAKSIIEKHKKTIYELDLLKQKAQELDSKLMKSMKPDIDAFVAKKDYQSLEELISFMPSSTTRIKIAGYIALIKSED